MEPVKLTYVSHEDVKRVLALVQKAGLPTSLRLDEGKEEEKEYKPSGTPTERDEGKEEEKEWRQSRDDTAQGSPQMDDKRWMEQQQGEVERKAIELMKTAKKSFTFGHDIVAKDVFANDVADKQEHVALHGTAKVNFEAICKRMIAFAKKETDDLDTLVLIWRIFNDHLVHSRQIKDKKGKDVIIECSTDLSRDELEKYRKSQSMLCDLGLVPLAFSHCCDESYANAESNLGAEAFKLLRELAKFGNKDVQESVHRLLTEDLDGLFVAHIQQRLIRATEKATAALTQRRLVAATDHAELAATHWEHRITVTSKILPDMDEGQFDGELSFAIDTVGLLQHLCENHFLKLQNMLRNQPHARVSINIWNSVATLLHVFCAKQESLAHMESKELELLTETLKALKEAVQGPAPENQRFLCTVEMISDVERIFDSPLSPAGYEHRQKRMECKREAADLLQGLVEMQLPDSRAMQTLSSHLRMKTTMTKFVRAIGIFMAINNDRLQIEYEEHGISVETLQRTSVEYRTLDFLETNVPPDPPILFA